MKAIVQFSNGNETICDIHIEESLMVYILMPLTKKNFDMCAEMQSACRIFCNNKKFEDCDYIIDTQVVPEAILDIYWSV